MNVFLRGVLVSAAFLLSHTTWAESSETSIEEIVVSAHPLSAEGLAQASTILAGDELTRRASASIGDTLKRTPGVHNAEFGPAAGRPVIHGLAGPRVRVMQDRIDTLDVSVTSADHATMVDPFVAEQVEVLKGASTLLYGSGAIGGVVDVHSGRIPHEVPEEISGGIESRYNGNSDGQTTSFKVNGGSGSIAWHLDGTWQDGDEYEIPGFAESDAQIAAEEAEGGEEEEEEEEVRGILPGSQYDSSNYAGGISYVHDRGFVGLSISRTEADYGLPGGHGHEEGEEGGEEEEEEEGNPVLDLEQTRIDLELGLENPFGNFEALNIRFGHNDYEHMEIEPSGEVATVFENDAWEFRSELVYATDNTRSAFGLQLQSRDFSAVGEEAFVPPVDRTAQGAFWVSEFNTESVQWEGGLRFDQVDYDPSVGPDTDFTTYALSIGGIVELTDVFDLSIVLDNSSRAPTTEELYSDGPHLATNAFEVGDPNLDEESATGLSATLKGAGEGWSFVATAYHTRFSDFIYEVGTGEEEDGLPVFQFLQDDADFTGLEAELDLTLTEWDSGSLSATAFFDLVEASVDVSGNDNIPRLPASRYGVGFDILTGGWTLGLEFLRVNEQDEPAPEELPTDSYVDISAFAQYEMAIGDNSLQFFLHGKNLTDEEQRNHTSFIKDFAPAPGRTVEAGLRFLL